jgi:hypothetical protein
MFKQKPLTSDRGVLPNNDSKLQEDALQSEHGTLPMEIFMDYCYFIEKLWLHWKQYYLRFFTLNE